MWWIPFEGEQPFETFAASCGLDIHSHLAESPGDHSELQGALKLSWSVENTALESILLQNLASIPVEAPSPWRTFQVSKTWARYLQMGCASSSSKATGGSIHGIRKLRSNKSLDSVDVSDDDMTKASNDIKNRQEREQALFQEIQAEKEALRKVAYRLIEQRCSCESLLDLLEDAELDTLKVSKDSVKQQKQAHLKLSKSRPVKIKDWIVSFLLVMPCWCSFL